MFDDPFFDFLDAIVIFLQHLTDGGEIKMFLGGFSPGKFKDQFEVGSKDLMIR